MKIPLSWLKAYIDVDTPPRELAHAITMAGLEVGSVDAIGGAWESISVGHVLSVEPHPNADRLTLCQVDTGSERIKVVCGAPNVAAGQKIAFARVGATLTDPSTGKPERLRAARIRGVTSEGMICSERELGLGDDHTGILVLDQSAPVGVPLSNYMGDYVLDTEPTTNRPDWLSVLGTAHEVAAVSGRPLTEPRISYPEDAPPIEDLASIFVDAPDLAPRYSASLILGVTIGPSPAWMQERLIKAGQRPINNLVDITNFVMLEYGQPLHAFDYDKLGGKTVRVRRATPRERLVTLDGLERRLSSDMLVIADANIPVGLAGVMGGANSEMTEATTNVLLESANFDPVSIRRTAAALRHRTDASTRFERGLNPELAPIGLRRATQLIVDLASGRAAKGIIDLYPGKQDQKTLRLSMTRVRQVLGVSYSLEESANILTSLGFTLERSDDTSLSVEVPYWRSDIGIEDDLVEELARIKGYDSVPTTSLSGGIPPHQPNPRRRLRERMRDLLVAAGMQETISYAATSLEALQGVQDMEEMGMPLRIANPMSQKSADFRASNIWDTLQYREYMRSTLRAGILETLGANQRFGSTTLKLFEVGRAYRSRADALPEEREMAVGILWGDRRPLSWTDQPGEVDFYDAKGIVEALLAHLRIKPEFAPVEDRLLGQGKAAAVSAAGQQVGVVGEVRPDILASFQITGTPVPFFELDIDRLLDTLPEEARAFTPLSRYPGAYRDIALLVDASVPAVHLEDIIQRNRLVESVTLFDVYTGRGVPEGKQSLAFRVHYRSMTRTLISEAIDAAQRQVLRDLERETGAVLRG